MKNCDYPKYDILKTHTQQIHPFSLDPARKYEKNAGTFGRALELLQTLIKGHRETIHFNVANVLMHSSLLPGNNKPTVYITRM